MGGPPEVFSGGPQRLGGIGLLGVRQLMVGCFRKRRLSLLRDSTRSAGRRAGP